MKCKALPIGIEFFSDMIRNDYYYVDKTGMIKELIENKGSVNLFTRPRRFGKTLNMTMLQSFFEVGTDAHLFDGLVISREKELCEKYLGKCPVIMLTLKSVKASNYEEAKERFWSLIKREAMRFDHLQESSILSPRDKQIMYGYTIGQGILTEALLDISRILYAHYGKRSVILIDEYDVPLQKAEEEGYYKEMVGLLSEFFSSGMKTNPYMEFAVVTGCLRVSKESIFTGFNNPKMHSIIDKEYNEWFGFTDNEVLDMLKYYEMEEQYAITKQWYNGYLFGNTHVYCPWDVINWINQIVRSNDYIPRNFWANSSGNQMIRRFADKADTVTKAELEQLIAGESIWKKINMELTYIELDDSIDNLWSVLFTTGYLTYKGRNEAGEFELTIPNKEINNLFRDMIEKWFKEKVVGDLENLKDFFEALDTSDEERLEECINYCLEESISYMDGGRQNEKEIFYHGMILGMLKARTGWSVLSNREAGDGRFDIVAYTQKSRIAMIFEIKSVRSYDELGEAANMALHQISDKKYDEFFDVRSMRKLNHIGIAFCKKNCRVMME